jgi:hypothetical protein
LQKRANPSPVPGPSTVYETPGLAALKSSATMLVIGSTVEEPEMERVPVSVETDALGEPGFEHAARSRAPATRPARAGRIRGECVKVILRA